METLSAQTAAAIAWWYDLGVVTGDLVLAARGDPLTRARVDYLLHLIG